MRIVYAGTPEFAVSALGAIARSTHPLVGVYTQPDRPAGRGRELQASPVKERALALGVPLRQPASLRTADAAAELAQFQPDVLVVAAYGLLLPQEILAVPRLGCINIHASLLPRWRGAAPIQRAIEAGDPETGISIMQMEKGLDTGPVYAQRRTPIGPAETGGELTARLAVLGADLLLEVLGALATGTVQAQPQPATGVTYARKLEKREAAIDWSQTARQLACRVRAFDPWPVAETLLGGNSLRIWAAQDLGDAAPVATPGTVVGLSAAGIDVATGSGTLRLIRIQASGRKPLAVKDFLNAKNAGIAVGTALGQ